jgi:hypothetical protein
MLYDGLAGHELGPTVEAGVQAVRDPPGVPPRAVQRGGQLVRVHVVIMGDRCGDGVRVATGSGHGGHGLPDGFVQLLLAARWAQTGISPQMSGLETQRVCDDVQPGAAEDDGGPDDDRARLGVHQFSGLGLVTEGARASQRAIQKASAWSSPLSFAFRRCCRMWTGSLGSISEVSPQPLSRTGGLPLLRTLHFVEQNLLAPRWKKYSSPHESQFLSGMDPPLRKHGIFGVA